MRKRERERERQRKSEKEREREREREGKIKKENGRGVRGWRRKIKVNLKVHREIETSKMTIER